MLELTGPQFRPLSDAFRAAFHLNQFDRMLKERLDISREDIALGDSYTDILFKVIDEANRTGRVHQLVDAARKERPGNPVFVEYAVMLGIGPVGLPDKARLESTIKRANSALDAAVFRSRLGEIEGRVCRIDLADAGVGTGFLIGPSAVLTNYHVIQSVVNREDPREDLSCRFDFKVREDGRSVNRGISCKVAKILTYRRFDDADLKESIRVPDPKNLDYALLGLDANLGQEPIGGRGTGDLRGWIRMRDEPAVFFSGSPLFIIQHPARKPLKIVLDTEAFIGINGNGTRVRYRTNTEPGSSGSPCFDQNWEIVALHQSGDPNWIPNWNAGIPIDLIAADINQQGLAKVFG